MIKARKPFRTSATMMTSIRLRQISREDGKRRVVVTANVRGRDIGSFVAEAEQKIQQAVKVPTGYWTTWGGTFEQLQFAEAFADCRSGGAAAGVYRRTIRPDWRNSGALAAGYSAFHFGGGRLYRIVGRRGAQWSGNDLLYPLLREEGRSLEAAIHEGALTRLRPVLMTALVASLGFIPMAIATGTGAEVQRPLATVVIGGILSSIVLTLLVLPLLYRLAHWREEEEGG